MSYGFQVTNTSGIPIANDTDFNWSLYHESTATFSSLGDVIRLSPSLTAISISEPMPLVFIRAASSRRIFLIQMDIFTQSSTGNRFWAPTAYIRNTDESTADPFPEVMEYRLYRPTNFVSYSGPDTTGIAVFNASGLRTFDSRLNPAVIAQVLQLSYPIWDGSSSSNPNGILFTVATPVNAGLGTPWLGSTDVYDNVIRKGIWFTGSARYRFDSYYQLLNNTTRGGYLPDTSFNVTSGTQQYWNNNSGKTHFVLMMRGTSTPLKVWVVQSTGGTSTSRTYYTQWTGGNCNAVTHSWQVIGGNAASFTLSYPYTNGVTLTYPAGTSLNTTLRLTLSQTGSTSAVVDTSISVIGGNLVSPMVGVPNTSWSFSDVAYNSATVSAKVAIWMTNDGQIWVEQGAGSPRNGAPTSAWWSGATYVFGGGVAGIGSSYWVRFTRTATTGSTSASTASTGWLSLATDQSVQIVVSQSGGTGGVASASATYTIEVASTSAGGAPISTTTGITISATADSVSGPEP